MGGGVKMKQSGDFQTPLKFTFVDRLEQES